MPATNGKEIATVMLTLKYGSIQNAMIAYLEDKLQSINWTRDEYAVLGDHVEERMLQITKDHGGR